MEGGRTGAGDEGGGGSRPYRMTARLRAVEETRERILRAGYELWLELPYDQVTLERVATAAGVSRQTLFRHFGTKDELAVAVVDWQRPLEEAARQAEPGDLGGALALLAERYETMGDANVRLLELEGRVPAIDYLLQQSRQSHRAWIERTFEGQLPPRRHRKAREHAVLALYAATDVTVWKLLRRDFGQSAADTAAVLRRLVDGVLQTIEHP